MSDDLDDDVVIDYLAIFYLSIPFVSVIVKLITLFVN